MKPKCRVIAFYLPQYHPTETNNKWYGQGFTEWTNVGKARPLFHGHYQPKVPKDLGYYDLRYPEVKELQAQMAREAGIEGFCYYHYWFGGGRRELEYPFAQVSQSGKPDFPFCLCWANQSWYSKFWNGDSVCAPRLIAEQKYDEEDIERHFYELLPAFKDKRYMKVDGKCIFMIYRPLEYPSGG
jgi:lipopolysaccharide biosynthesis protein